MHCYGSYPIVLNSIAFIFIQVSIQGELGIQVLKEESGQSQC